MVASDRAIAFAAAVTMNVAAAAHDAGLTEILLDPPTVTQMGNLAVRVGANVADWVPLLASF